MKFLIGLVFSVCLFGQAKLIPNIPGAIAAPGTPAVINLSFTGGGMGAAGVQATFAVPTGTTIVADPSLEAAGKTLYYSISSTGSATFLVIGGSKSIPDGPLASINFASQPYVYAPTLPLGVTAAGALVSLVATGISYKNPCDLNGDGVLDTLDLRNVIDQIDGAIACTNGDLNGDLKCTIIDAQRIINAQAGGACVSGK
jgi:hypothetical protein